MQKRLRCFPGAVILFAPLALAQSYTISTVAGTTRLQAGNQATSVPLRLPYGVAQDAAGNVYIADQFDYRVLKVAVDGTIHILAGTGLFGR